MIKYNGLCLFMGVLKEYTREYNNISMNRPIVFMHFQVTGFICIPETFIITLCCTLLFKCFLCCDLDCLK